MNIIEMLVGYFDYNENRNIFVAEISELRYKVKEHFICGQDMINLVNPETGNSQAFKFSHRDEDGSGEDIYGWNYKSEEGIKLLIIND